MLDATRRLAKRAEIDPWDNEGNLVAIAIHEEESLLLVELGLVTDAATGQTAVSEHVATMTPIIVERFRPIRIVLFGSRARGDARPDSDVDLLIAMDGDVDRRRLAVEMRKAVRDLPVPKDIVVTTSQEIARRGHVIGTVLREALREGKEVYARP